MKTTLKILTVLMIFTFISCSKDESVIDINSRNATDCGLNNDPEFIGICADGSASALQNEVLTYASKSSPNFSEILWIIESGNIEVVNIENSSIDGFNKSIATVKFNLDFSGGIIKVKTRNESGEFAEMLINIELENSLL